MHRVMIHTLTSKFPKNADLFNGRVRMGAFRGGGSMPPFSREVLADEDVAGLLAFFGL